MRLEIRSQGVGLPRGLSEFLEQRLRGALLGSGELLNRVNVDLFTESTDAGTRVICAIHAHLDCGDLVVESRQGNAFAAAAEASDRIGLVVADYLGRVGVFGGHAGVFSPGAA